MMVADVQNQAKEPLGVQQVVEAICNPTHRTCAFSGKLKYGMLECLMDFEAPVSVCGDRCQEQTNHCDHKPPQSLSEVPTESDWKDPLVCPP